MRKIYVSLLLVAVMMGAASAYCQKKVTLTGNKFSALVPPLDIELFFQAQNQMTFTIREGGGIVPNGYSETVKTNIAEIRPNLYFLSWQEKSGATVTHVEDYDNTILYSNISLDNGTFLNLVGVIKPLGSETRKSTPDTKDTLAGRKIEVEIDNKRMVFFFTTDSLHISESGMPPQIVYPKVTAVYSQIYLVTWQESSKATVVQLIDIKKRRTWVNYTTPGMAFTQKQGNLRVVD